MKRHFIFVIILMLLVSCSRIFRKPPLSTEAITVQEIRNRVEQNSWKLSTLKGHAYLSVEMPGVGFTAASQIALKMPDSLKIKVKAGFGMGVGTIVIGKERFTIYSYMENRVYHGDVSSFDLSQFFPINIRFQDLIGLISGIPIITESKYSSFTIDKNKYCITFRKKKLIKKYWIDPKKFVVTDLQLLRDNKELLLKQEFRQFNKEHGVYLPKVIKISRPRSNERITLLFKDRQTNGKLTAKDFLIKLPENIQEIDL